MLQGVCLAVFGFRCFLGPSLSPSLFPGALSSSSFGLQAGRPTSAMWAGGSCMAAPVFLSFSSLCLGRPPSPSLLPPSSLSLSFFLFLSLSFSLFSFFLFLSLSFSLSLACTQTQRSFLESLRELLREVRWSYCPLMGCHSVYGVLRELLRELRRSFCLSRGTPSREWKLLAACIQTRELLRELRGWCCSSCRMPSREWNFVFQDWNFAVQELQL